MQRSNRLVNVIMVGLAAGLPGPRCTQAGRNVRCEAIATKSAPGRRLLLLLASTTPALAGPREALALPGFQKDLNKPRRSKIPREKYTFNEDGLGVYDVEVGGGDPVMLGDRVAVHFDCKWKTLTVYTSRQGMGVTGGNPLGFDVGAEGAGGTLKGLDLGVRGMRVGGRRSLIVPPNLAWGDRQVGEVPPNSELTIEVEVLSIKRNPLGRRIRRESAEEA